MDGVALSWRPSLASPGAEQSYSVQAKYGTNTSAASPSITGQRALPVFAYEVTRDEGTTWLQAGTAAEFLDTGAPRGQISGVSVTATEDGSRGLVVLKSAGVAVVSAPQDVHYRVRASSFEAVSTPSIDATGHRGGGTALTALTYQWQRSAADSDSNYADLPGVTGSTWVDSSAPTNAGRYYRAQLSNPSASSVTPGTRAELSGYKKIASSGDHTCGLRTDGKVTCWGSNASGQAPPGPSSDTFTTLTAGVSHTCGIRTDGKVMCWGDNGSGQAPTGSSADAFTALAAGYLHTSGLRTDGKVMCWGNNGSGQAPRP